MPPANSFAADEPGSKAKLDIAKTKSEKKITAFITSFERYSIRKSF